MQIDTSGGFKMQHHTVHKIKEDEEEEIENDDFMMDDIDDSEID